MPRCLVFILALLTASPALADGPELLFMAVGGCRTPTTAVNGISSIENAGPTDTGTENVSRSCGGVVTAEAVCSGNFGSANVFLVVDGSIRDTLSCGDSAGGAKTLSYAVTGDYTVRVYGVKTGTGTYAAYNFNIP